MIQVAAAIFGISTDRIKLETTNTTRVANTSPSAASATADLNGKAVEYACNSILERIKEVVANHHDCKIDDVEIKDEIISISGKAIDWSWEQLVMTSHLDRINLSEKGHYSTPNIHFDKSKEKGHPFAYHVYGTSIHIVTVDCVRGIYEFDAVKIVHDYGKSMNDDIDLGQVEGAMVQGLGWMTMEEIIYNEKGKLLSNALSTYKIPDIYSVPKEVSVKPLETEGHPLAIRKSKAVGEPPLMYGIGGYFCNSKCCKSF